MRTPVLVPLALTFAACGSAPEPVVRQLSDGAPASVDGLPNAWAPWVGFDDWGEPDDVDWRAHLEGRDDDGASGVRRLRPGDGCVFEIVHRDGDELRRWHVLVRPDPDEPGLRWGTARTTPADGGRAVEYPIAAGAVLVSVAPEGRAIGEARTALVPMSSPQLGYVLAADVGFARAKAAIESDGALSDAVAERSVATRSRPGASLLAMFTGIQGHAELSEILREVVDAPSALSIVLGGGLKLSLTSDFESIERCDCPIGPERVEPGVRFPASLRANGDPALEMEIYATQAVRPVHVTGGLVALRAWRPDDESESVELRLIGARSVTLN